MATRHPEADTFDNENPWRLPPKNKVSENGLCDYLKRLQQMKPPIEAQVEGSL